MVYGYEKSAGMDEVNGSLELIEPGLQLTSPFAIEWVCLQRFPWSKCGG